MTTETIDPVAQPSAYRQQLLDRLGDLDPAEVQSTTAAEMRRLVADAGPQLRERPASAEWSVLELVGHIVDAELVVGGRYRWILAHDRPEIVAYDQDLWVSRLRHNEAEPDELLAPFDALRIANLALWSRASTEERARYGLHSERGPESYELTFRLLSGHDLFHIDQARQTLDTVRARGATATETR